LNCCYRKKQSTDSGQYRDTEKEYSVILFHRQYITSDAKVNAFLPEKHKKRTSSMASEKKPPKVANACN